MTVVHTGPVRATNLGKQWHHGNIILLQNLGSRKNLRINKQGYVDGLGGEGQWAQFMVERVGADRVKLRNMGHNNYLRVHNPHQIDHGPGGPHCEFYVVKHGHKTYSLESVAHPGCHVGIHDNGSAKQPGQTGTGKHAQFNVVVHRRA